MSINRSIADLLRNHATIPDVAVGSSGNVLTSDGTDWTSAAAPSTDLTAIADGSVSAPSLANSGDDNTGVYFPAADTVGVTAGGTEQFRFGSNPIPGGNKNMLINGSMAVAQRGELTGQGGSDFYTTCDRWKLDDTNGMQARFTTSQGTSGGVSGKDPWLSINVTTAESAVASNEKNGWNQFVEGNNARQLINSSGQLKASAISFDVKFKKGGGSSLSAPYTMCMVLICENNGYGWVEEISITADDTWEHKSFSIDALAQAASDVDTSSGYRLQFVMMAGTNYNTASAGWGSNGTANPATSNQDNLADATGNILGITNVQWEVGSVATDFAHEDYETTLAKGQRYFWRAAAGDQWALPHIAQQGTTSGSLHFIFPATMRAVPTVAYSDLSHFGVQPNVSQQNPNVISISYPQDNMSWVYMAWSSSGSGTDCVRAYTISASATLDFSAEL